MCVGEYKTDSARVCVRERVSACVFVSVCVCVSGSDRKRKKERHKEGGADGRGGRIEGSGGGGGRESVCARVPVCASEGKPRRVCERVRDRERKKERVCVCKCVCERERKTVCKRKSERDIKRDLGTDCHAHVFGIYDVCFDFPCLIFD